MSEFKVGQRVVVKGATATRLGSVTDVVGDGDYWVDVDGDGIDIYNEDQLEPPPVTPSSAGELAAIRERLETARKEVDGLCHGARWVMRIPVGATDSDVLITNALNDIDTLLAALADADAQRVRQEEALERQYILRPAPRLLVRSGSFIGVKDVVAVNDTSSVDIRFYDKVGNEITYHIGKDSLLSLFAEAYRQDQAAFEELVALKAAAALAASAPAGDGQEAALRHVGALWEAFGGNDEPDEDALYVGGSDDE